jgi:hypothetical protein
MNEIESKYQRLVLRIPAYGNSTQFSISKIQNIAKVGFPCAKAFHDRLFHEGMIDSEGYKTDRSYPFSLALKELKRAKRYCGRSFPYPLPLGETEDGVRKFCPLSEVGNLFIESKDTATGASVLRAIIVSLIIGGSKTKPHFFGIEPSESRDALFENSIQQIVSWEKVTGDAVKALPALLERKAKSGTPIVVIIPKLAELISASKGMEPALIQLAQSKKKSNLFVIALAPLKGELNCSKNLRKSFDSNLKLRFEGEKSVLVLKGKKQEQLIVPQLSQKEFNLLINPPPVQRQPRS